MFFNGRRLRKLQEAQIRERIAANLHDELGANLHAIGLLGAIEHTFTYTGEDLLKSLKRRTRIDFLLFYKECLANVIRHSDAAAVEVDPTADQEQVKLTVTDNGRGLHDKRPKALARRARLLGAGFTTKIPDAGQGTEISLILPPPQMEDATKMKRAIKIMLVEDNQEYSEVIQLAISRSEGMEFVGAFVTAEIALRSLSPGDCASPMLFC